MTRIVKSSLIAILIVLVAMVTMQTAMPQRADAAPVRPALTSARSAVLVQDYGTIQLRNAGAPSRNAIAVIQQTVGRNGVRPNLEIGKAIEEACQTLADSAPGTNLWFVGDMLGSMLSTACTIVGKFVLFMVEKTAELVAWGIHHLFMPILEWLVTQSLGIALGIPIDKCFDKDGNLKAGATADRACNGNSASSRVLQVATGQTAETIIWLSLVMALPLLLAAVISAIIKQSLSELGKTLLRLPFVWILSAVGVYVLSVAVGFRDGIVSWLISQTHMLANMHAFFDKGGSFNLGDVGATLMQLLVVLASLIGALMLAFIFLVADIVILVSVLFIPLSTVGLIWGGTAKWFKRIGELSFGFIIGKVVMVGILALGFELLK